MDKIISSIVGVVLLSVSVAVPYLPNTDCGTPHNPVWIDFNKNGVFDPGEWNGLSIRCAIENSTEGGMIVVESNYSSSFDTFPIRVNISVSLVGKDAVIDGNGSEKVLEILSDNVLLTGFLIEGGTKWNIVSSGFSNIKIVNNTILNSKENIGLYHGENLDISQNKVYGGGMFGLFVGFSRDVNVNDNLFSGCGIGGQACSLTIKNNTICYLNSSKWTAINLCAIDGNVDVAIINNTIYKNSCGIFFYNETDYHVTADVHFNKIHENSFYGISNKCGDIINATYNWWGSDNGPSGSSIDPFTGIQANGDGDRVSNGVSFDPWLPLKKNRFPIMEITKPKSVLYFRDRGILNLRMTLIIGYITIKVNATDSDGIIEKVEFLIDNVSKYNDTAAPYYWVWNERIFGRHIITVRAYDNDGAFTEKSIRIFILNFGRSIV